jgi:hypothetical protein
MNSSELPVVAKTWLHAAPAACAHEPGPPKGYDTREMLGKAPTSDASANTQAARVARSLVSAIAISLIGG